MRRYGLLSTVCFLAALTTSPSAQTSTWRPVVLSDTGMVASGHALASEAGIRILKSGGNAVDAAVAAWAVQGLTEPEMTGIGGDMFMLIYIAKTGEVKFINGTGVAPMAATVDFYRARAGCRKTASSRSACRARSPARNWRPGPTAPSRWPS
jgi:gamma-glutamyltranspeptidase